MDSAIKGSLSAVGENKKWQFKKKNEIERCLDLSNNGEVPIKFVSHITLIHYHILLQSHSLSLHYPPVLLPWCSSLSVAVPTCFTPPWQLTNLITTSEAKKERGMLINQLLSCCCFLFKEQMGINNYFKSKCSNFVFMCWTKRWNLWHHYERYCLMKRLYFLDQGLYYQTRPQNLTENSKFRIILRWSKDAQFWSKDHLTIAVASSPPP